MIEDRYQLKFKNINIWYRIGKHDTVRDFSRYEKSLYEERDPSIVANIDYKFDNIFYDLRIFQEFPELDSKIWKAGEYPIPYVPEQREVPFSVYLDPKNESGSNAGLQIVTRAYKINDVNFYENEYQGEFWSTTAGYPGAKKVFVREILAEGHKDDVWYDAIQTLRATRELVEKLFPGWSMK